MLNLLSAIIENPVHKNVLTHWKNAKEQQGLLDLFGDKLIIEKEIYFEKSKEEIVKVIKECNLNKDLLELAVKDVNTEKYDDYINFAFYISNPYALSTQVLSGGFNFISPHTNKKVSIQAGTKISRCFKHLVKDPQELERIQIKYSQILNNQKIKGTLCLSIHPADYLTVSYNDCGWSSCFHVLDGQFRASTTALLASPNTMVAYIKATDDMEFTYNGVECVDEKWNSKKWRALVTLSGDKKIVHVGRQYPYHSESALNEIVNMTKELTGEDYGEVKKSPRWMGITCNAMFYNDGCCTQGISAATSLTEEELEIGQPVLNISDNNICLDCGDLYSHNREGSLYCNNCDESVYCEYCDSYYSPCDMRDLNGEPVCDSCYHDCTRECEQCGHLDFDGNLWNVLEEDEKTYVEEICVYCKEKYLESGKYEIMNGPYTYQTLIRKAL